MMMPGPKSLAVQTKINSKTQMTIEVGRQHLGRSEQTISENPFMCLCTRQHQITIYVYCTIHSKWARHKCSIYPLHKHTKLQSMKLKHLKRRTNAKQRKKREKHISHNGENKTENFDAIETFENFLIARTKVMYTFFVSFRIFQLQENILSKSQLRKRKMSRNDDEQREGESSYEFHSKMIFAVCVVPKCSRFYRISNLINHFTISAAAWALGHSSTKFILRIDDFCDDCAHSNGYRRAQICTSIHRKYVCSRYFLPCKNSLLIGNHIDAHTLRLNETKSFRLEMCQSSSDR